MFEKKIEIILDLSLRAADGYKKSNIFMDRKKYDKIDW